MSPIIKENKDIPPEPPEILKTLRWLQLHWKRHWKLITVAGLILTTPLIWKGLSLLLSQRTQMPPVIMNTVADLESSDPDQQLEAIRNLSKLNHPAARKAIEYALHHPNWKVKCLATLALAKRGGSKSVSLLLKILQDEDNNCRYYALWALSSFRCPDVAYPIIRQFLQSKDDLYRATAVRALGHAKQSSDIPTLIEALEDTSPIVRNYAIEVLESFGETAIPQVLTTTQRPHSVQGRYALVKLLGSIGDDRAIPFLLSQLSENGGGKLSTILVNEFNIALGGGGSLVSAEARCALERLGTSKALAVLDSLKRPGRN